MVRTSRSGPDKPERRKPAKSTSTSVTPSPRRWARMALAGGVLAVAGTAASVVAVDPAAAAPIGIAVAVAGLLVNIRKSR